MISEHRIIKASIMTALCDVLIGILAYFTGVGDWYYAHFHVFGVFGVSLLIYGLWHSYYLLKDTGEKVWQIKRNSSKKSLKYLKK
jgi:hypothetical protein